MPPTIRIQTPTSKPGKSGSVLSRAAPLNEQGSGVKMLLYGKSGSGKTTLWGTFPGKILAVITSGGVNAGELKSIDTPANRKRISKLQIDSTDDLTTLCRELRESNPFDLVVVDHVTGMYDVLLKDVLGHDDVKLQKSWGMATQQQYGTATMRCKEILRDLINLRCGVVLVAQERAWNDGGEDGGNLSDLGIKPTVGAALTKGVLNWLYPACDFVVQTFIRPKTETRTVKVGDKQVSREERVKGVDYCLRCEPHDVFMTKFRSPKGTLQTDVIVDPDYEKIMAASRGEEVG